jgi:hypothetical protein
MDVQGPTNGKIRAVELQRVWQTQIADLLDGPIQMTTKEFTEFFAEGMILEKYNPDVAVTLVLHHQQAFSVNSEIGMGIGEDSYLADGWFPIRWPGLYPVGRPIAHASMFKFGMIAKFHSSDYTGIESLMQEIGRGRGNP